MYIRHIRSGKFGDPIGKIIRLFKDDYTVNVEGYDLYPSTIFQAYVNMFVSNTTCSVIKGWVYMYPMLTGSINSRKYRMDDAWSYRRLLYRGVME